MTEDEDTTTRVLDVGELAAQLRLRIGSIMLGITLLTALMAFLDPTVLRVTASLALAAMTAATWSARDSRPVPGVAMLGACVALFSLSGGTEGQDQTVLAAITSLAAYPFLGRALLQHVSRYRMLRRSDLLVEAVLIGSAATIVLQSAVDWRLGDDAAQQLLLRISVSSLLVGIDVAMLVVVAWSLRVPEARNGPIGPLAAGVTALTAAHVVRVVGATIDIPATLAGEILLAGFVVAVGVAVVQGTLLSDHVPSALEPPLFSVSHAVVVVVALLAAPTVLVTQTVRGLSVSTTVAVGTALSGIVLANYLVELLRERASSEHQATHDPLTELPNRVLFLDRLERAIAQADRRGDAVGVLYLDLDGFKDVNDTLGHDAGDQLLQITASRLLASARHEDTVARLAGDEFAILLPRLRSADDAVIVAERVLEALSEPAPLAGHQLRNPASIGLSTYPADGAVAADIVTAADDAMYRAKEKPGARLELSSGPSTVHAARLATETALHAAIQRDELVLHYQPIFDATTSQLVGVEALVRWNHPEQGLLGPFHFIPVAEQSDLIVELGTWVLRAACAEQARLSRDGFGHLFISVNVSSRQFDERLVSTVTAALRETGANPRRMVIEVTESAAVDDLAVVAEGLDELRKLGLSAAIDDFGTGYSSLQYLGDLPVTTLKIDKSFVQSMTPRAAAIVAATIAMGHSLGMTIVAEGVETPEQQRFLTHHGCDRLQGYHLAKPMPIADLRLLLGVEAPTPTSDDVRATASRR